MELIAGIVGRINICVLQVFLKPERRNKFDVGFGISKYSCDLKCDVEFTVNRSTLKTMHRSLGIITNEVIERLFPPASAKPNRVALPDDLELFNQVEAWAHDTQ